MGPGQPWQVLPTLPAYCRAALVAVAWIREHASGPVQVITAGPGIAAGRDNGQDVSPETGEPTP